MTPENFVYWLQGYFELCEIGEKGETYYPEIKGDQVKVIRDHLKLVFDKKTPIYKINVPPMSGKTNEVPPYYFGDDKQVYVSY